MEWISCDQSWPRHPDKNWRLVIEYARKNNWYFKKYTNHVFAKISCSDNAKAPRCQVTLYSSARGTESFSKIAHKMITRCNHRA